MDALTTIEVLRSIASDILLFGGALSILIFLVLLVFILRGVVKTMKIINNLNDAFMQLRIGIEKLLDPLMMFVNMLRMSIEKTKKSTKKNVTKKKTTAKTTEKKIATKNIVKKKAEVKKIKK